MNRDFVWEADYGDRKDVIKATKIMLRDMDASSLQCISYFVNNNPYNLEFYVVASFNVPTEQEIEDMTALFNDAGIQNRVDVTMDSLMKEVINRRFNTIAFNDESTVDFLIDSIFCFPERSVLEGKGFVMKPFSRKNEVFISHASEDKDVVKMLIPYLNAGKHAVWFDEYSIDVGDSLIEKITDGILNATAVVLWVTQSFLDSSWCMKEVELANNMSRKIIICLDSEIRSDSLPQDILKYKYLEINSKDSVENVAEKILKEIHGSNTK